MKSIAARLALGAPSKRELQGKIADGKFVSSRAIIASHTNSAVVIKYAHAR